MLVFFVSLSTYSVIYSENMPSIGQTLIMCLKCSRASFLPSSYSEKMWCAGDVVTNALLQPTTAQWSNLYIKCLGEFMSNWQIKISNRLILIVGKVNGTVEWIEMWSYSYSIITLLQEVLLTLISPNVGLSGLYIFRSSIKLQSEILDFWNLIGSGLIFCHLR